MEWRSESVRKGDYEMKTKLHSLPHLILALVVILLETPGFSVATGVSNKTEKAYILRSVYVKNQTSEYKVGVNKIIKILTDKGAILSPHGVEKVKSVGIILEKTMALKPNGSAEMKVWQIGWRNTDTGKAIPSRIPPLNLNVDKEGVITKAAELQTIPNVNEIMNAFMIYLPPGMVLFPNKAVKPGDVWTVSIPNPYWNGSPVEVRSRLVGMERIGGAESLRVSQFYSIPISYQFDKKGDYSQDSQHAVTSVVGTVYVSTVNYVQPRSAILLKRDENVRWELRFTGLNAVAKSNIKQKSVRFAASASVHSQLLKVEEPKARSRKR